MDAMRRFVLPLALALSVSVAGLWLLHARREVQPSDRQAMSSAAAHFDSVLTTAWADSATLPSDDVVVAIGYLERLRRGLSSPFRLVSFAMHDPRLAPSDRQRVALALLAGLNDGSEVAVDPMAFGIETDRGRALFGILEREIRVAPDPRTAELAVRLAASMAAAQTTISSQDASVAIQAAALLRDRALARRDLDELLRRAARDRASVLQEVLRARAARQLSAERPPLVPLPADAEHRAIDRATVLLTQMEHLDLVSHGTAQASTLPARIGARLAVLALAQPPEPAVVVTVASLRRHKLHAALDFVDAYGMPVT